MSIVLGGEVGVNVDPDIEIYGSGTFMKDVLPKSIQDDLDTLSTLLTLATGDLWSFKAKIRNVAGLAGVPDEIGAERGLDDASTTKPYLELGGGAEFGSSRLFLDAGYRYGRVIDDDGINVSRLHFGIGARF